MAQTTLLDVVQEVLSAMDSDEVNSIADTIESEQVVSIAKSVYRNMVSNRNWPFFRRAIQFNSSGNLNLPTHMYLQDEVKELEFVNYDVQREGSARKRYDRMHWLEPDDFLYKTNQNNDDADNTTVVTDPSGIELVIRNDTPPKYYTSFDDTTIVFDAYDSAVDDTLISSKMQALGYIMPTFVSSDTWVIDLPREAISAFIADVKSTCFVDLKQQVNDKAESVARRQQAWLSRKDWRAHGGIQYQNYGRRGKKGGLYNPPFDKSSYINRSS
jgi:hypothetical protein